jgi:hypothetical protein
MLSSVDGGKTTLCLEGFGATQPLSLSSATEKDRREETRRHNMAGNFIPTTQEGGQPDPMPCGPWTPPMTMTTSLPTAFWGGQQQQQQHQQQMS